MTSARPKKHDSSITPQRKHRKLLKDGSGTEVWPESIEKVFVQGLREYWDSPYATYSQSRGRSRWRNQFLVDYLLKQGIDRSKKQVASHIQVLRNMWKGEPEFHLVAGGDELYPGDSDSPLSLPVKLEDNYDPTSNLIPFDWEDQQAGGSGSSNPVSPNFSPADSQAEFPPTPEHRPNVALYPSAFDYNQSKMPLSAGANPHVQMQLQMLQQQQQQNNSYGHFPPPQQSPSPFTPSQHGMWNGSPSDFGLPAPLPQFDQFGGPANKYGSSSPFSAYGTVSPASLTSPAPSGHSHSQSQSMRSAAQLSRQLTATPSHYRYSAPTPLGPSPALTSTRGTPAPQSGSKVASVQLRADGMTPFSVKVDALALPGRAVQPPFELRIRLGVPAPPAGASPPSPSRSGSSVSANPTAHGFQASVVLPGPWTASARCITRAYTVNGGIQTPLSAEQGALQLTDMGADSITATLPDSALGRCRWLDSSVPITITQEILVDDATVLFMAYELDRQMSGPMPSAALRGYQKYRGASSSPPFPTSSPASATASTHASSASPVASLPYPLHSSSSRASSAASSPFGANAKIGISNVFPNGTHSNNSSISSLGSLGGSLTSASSSATIHGGPFSHHPPPASPYGVPHHQQQQQQQQYMSPQAMSMHRPF